MSFDQTAIEVGHRFGLFPKNDFGHAAAIDFIDHTPFVPDALLEESRGDVMTYTPTGGNMAFPTERIRAWALLQMGTAAQNFYTRDLGVN